MKDIQKVSSYFVLIFVFLIFVVPFFHVLQWIFMGGSDGAAQTLTSLNGLLEKTIRTPEGIVNLSAVAWTPSSKMLGFLADMIGLSPFLISLFWLKELFSHYTKGEVFSTKNATIYRNLGVLYMADAVIIKTISHTLMVLAATLNNAPGHRFLEVSFGTSNLTSLFYVGLVILVSWVMLEASKMFDENQYTV